MKTNRMNIINADAGFVIGLALLTLIAFLLSSCKSSDEGPDARDPFIGTYSMVDTDQSGGTETYVITLSKGSGGVIEISNFANFMKVPVKATVDGDNLTIPLQNFTNPGAASGLDISGAGARVGDVITGGYTWVLGDYDPVTKEFQATKQ